MASPTNCSYFYRATFIHEADFEQNGPCHAARSHSAPAVRIGTSRCIDVNRDDERRNYTEKLAAKVDEFLRGQCETSETIRENTPSGSSIAAEDLLPSMLFDTSFSEELPCEHSRLANFYDATTDGMATPDELQFLPASATDHVHSYEHMALPSAPMTRFRGHTSSIQSTMAPSCYVPATDLNTADFDEERDLACRVNCGSAQRYSGSHLVTLPPDRGITTFMVRNIPCRITKQQLKVSLDSLNLEGTYDFLHLPMTESGTSNLGYFFINFATAEIAAEKVPIFEGYRFPNTNSPKVCTVRPARLQGFAANIRQFGCDVRGKVQADVEYNCGQRKMSSKIAVLQQPDETNMRNTASTMPDSCFRQVSEMSTVASYDENSEASESEACEHASDGEAAGVSPSGLVQKTAAVSLGAHDLEELPKGSAVLMKVKRSRPPKFIRERMKRKHRDEAISAAAAQQNISQSTSPKAAPSTHGTPKMSTEATVASRSAVVHLADTSNRGHDGGHQIFYPTFIPGQQQQQHHHRPPPR